MRSNKLAHLFVRLDMRMRILRWMMFVSLLMFFQEPAKAETFNTLLSKANQAWKNKEYTKSQAMFARITESYGQRAMMLFGSRFGEIYYRKGITELKLASVAKRTNKLEKAEEWFSEAAESFKICHENFGNNAVGAKGITRFGRAALQRWAEACMGLKEYKKAAGLFEKFEQIKLPEDKYLPTPGNYQINVAICHFLMDPAKIEEGVRHFEVALGKRAWGQKNDEAE